jgi:hypothetical protein
MSDDELNAEVMRLQSQPDGLMAAMALIEAQNLLRQQDSFAYSQWQLQAQMQAASAPPIVSEPEPQAPPQVVPETITAEPVITPAEAVAIVPPAVNPPVVSPLAPAPSETAVDDIVAALNRNYENAETDQSVATELAEPVPVMQNDPVGFVEPEPIASLPTVAIETSSEPELEEDQEAIEVAEVSRTKTSAAFSWSWISVASSPLVLVLAAFLKESGASLAQALVVIAGLIVTTAVLAGIGSVAAKRGSSSIGVVSRAAFGVWGNVFPATVMLLVKIVWSIALLIFGARILSPLISSQPWFAVISAQFVFPAEFTALMLTAIPMVLISSLVAGFGGIAMLRAQQVAGAFSLIGILGIG